MYYHNKTGRLELYALKFELLYLIGNFSPTLLPQELGVVILVHNRFILIHKTGITLWLQSKTVRNLRVDLRQMWSLTRTPREFAISHMLRFQHYKVQGRQSLKFKV